MKGRNRLQEIYAGSPVLLTLVLVLAGVLGIYWGYRFIGPFLAG
jgi:hypothetical protein